MRNHRITFPGATGAELSAVLSTPVDEEVRACALFAHCFTCSKDLKPVVNISRALTQRGIAVMRFDFTGLGESEGDFAATTFSSNIEDLVAAAAFMRAQFEAPALLIGHSLGGAAVLQAATRLPVDAVATIGAPFDPGHVKHLFVDAIDDIERAGHADVVIAGRRFTLRREFVRDLERHRVEEAIGSLRRPLLIMHSPVDRTVGIENAALIYQAARHPKSFVSLDDADHLLLEERDSLYAGTVLAAWAGRYIAPLPRPASRDELRASDRRVAATTEAGAFRTEIRVRDHSIVADEPEAVGGEDLGPTPYDLLGAALSACTSMTLQMYAARKEWPLEETIVRVEHSRIHADDREEGDARLDRLDREVTVIGPLDDAQRARLLEIADRCPVHRTLSAGMVIETTPGTPAGPDAA